MNFESVIENLKKKSFLLDSLGQTNDGKKWSANVRKKGTTKQGYGYGKNFETAIKEAIKNMKDPFDPKTPKGHVKNPKQKSKRRIRL